MDIKAINTAIVTGTWTNAELLSMGDAIKFARSRLTATKKAGLRVGQNVSFTSNKNGMTYKGTVNKVAIKYVTVATPQGMWRVPANMLEVE
jgi:hypothetical protein